MTLVSVGSGWLALVCGVELVQEKMGSKSHGLVTILLVCTLHMWQHPIGCCKSLLLQHDRIQGFLFFKYSYKGIKVATIGFFFFFPQYGLKIHVITLCFFSKTSILTESLGYSRDQASYTAASEWLKKSQYSFA
jgi:hypothetical protein